MPLDKYMTKKELEEKEFRDHKANVSYNYYSNAFGTNNAKSVKWNDKEYPSIMALARHLKRSHFWVLKQIKEKNEIDGSIPVITKKRRTYRNVIK